MDEIAAAPELARVARERTDALLTRVRSLGQATLEQRSELPDWTRLTIVCHLRYGTRALLRMTRDALKGRATSYYPKGRALQRPATLEPSPGETTPQILNDWKSVAADLDREWSAIADEQWSTPVVEPADNPDLGTVPLARLALSRLTEVDVHGTDLGIGVPDWSPTLIAVGLPTRLGWLSSRRANHRASDHSIQGSWLLDALDGPRWFVKVDGDIVESRPAAESEDARAVIEGSSRDLLALLLGRPIRQPLTTSGDLAFADAFQRAFPGP